MKRSKRLSRSFLKAAMPNASMAKSTGIKIAAARGTETAQAMTIIDTANEPSPTPRPLLLMPSNSTAGTETR